MKNNKTDVTVAYGRQNPIDTTFKKSEDKSKQFSN